LRRQFPIDWFPANAQLRRYDFSLRGIVWARRMEADLVYTRLPQAAALAAKLGMATMLEIHDLPQGRGGPLLLRTFLNGRGARRLVVITHALAADLADRFNAPSQPPFTIVAPDGVDLERYSGLPDPHQARRMLAEKLKDRRHKGESEGLAMYLAGSPFTAGYSGHLYPGRGRDMLLALAGRLPEITFLIVGGQPGDIQAFKERAKAANINNIHLAGFVPNADLPLYQAACDVLLMPYQKQVAASSGGDIAPYLSPMKLFEYLACQRAILSSDLPVLREVLNVENAVLLPHDDVQAWAAALLRVKKQPAYRRRLAGQARRDANKYTWEARVKRILEGIVV
jgi:glycosyltransferase involved in cell wall biosynthesis